LHTSSLAVFIRHPNSIPVQKKEAQDFIFDRVVSRNRFVVSPSCRSLYGAVGSDVEVLWDKSTTVVATGICIAQTLYHNLHKLVSYAD